MRRIRPFLLAVLAAVLVAGAPAGAQTDTTDTEPGLDQTIDEGQETASGPADLDLGHVDMGPRFHEGEWTMMIHDDSVEPSVWRTLEDAVLQVHDTALLPVPDDPNYEFLGVEPGTEVHVIPQTQSPDVVWLGWNTQDPDVLEQVDRGVTMSLLGVDGPGEMTTYLQAGNLEPPDVLWRSTETEAQPVWVEVNTHTHANWVFTEPGVYLLQIEVTADLISGETVTDTATVRLAVGDGTSTDDARAATFEGEAAEPPSDDGAGANAEGGDATAPEETRASAGDDSAADDGIDPVVLVIAGVVAVALLAAVVLVAVRGASAKRRAEEDRDDDMRPDAMRDGEQP